MKYTSIEKVLYEVSTLMDGKNFNHKKFKHWAIQGYKKFSMYQKYVELFYISYVSSHKAPLPDNFVAPIQIAYVTDTVSDAISELKIIMNLDNAKDNPALTYITDPESLPTKSAQLITSLSWKPLRLGSSSFSKIVDVPEGALYSAYNTTCVECEQTYALTDTCITTSFKDGFILMAYLGYPTDKEGNILIPDDVEVIEAISHYVLYKYWISKAQLKEESTFQLAAYHLGQYQTLKTKATAKITAPTVDQLENILKQRNRLIPSTNHYSSFFANLNSKVNE